MPPPSGTKWGLSSLQKTVLTRLRNYANSKLHVVF
uniref:Uncharacterized protein n=1 Tax=Arundo donax TaxID=35708 RepID=A0A0A8XW03_ARUDO